MDHLSYQSPPECPCAFDTCSLDVSETFISSHEKNWDVTFCGACRVEFWSGLKSKRNVFSFFFFFARFLFRGSFTWFPSVNQSSCLPNLSNTRLLESLPDREQTKTACLRAHAVLAEIGLHHSVTIRTRCLSKSRK